jgi:hypothetical protein
MKTQNVLIAGGGGICSWLVAELDRLRKYGQIPDTYLFTIQDYDTIEQKNLPYQNFDTVDLLDYKAKNLAERYVMSYRTVPILTDDQLDSFNIIMSGVDNAKFRRMLFNYMESHPEKYWVDMRAEGTQVALFTKHPENNLNKLLKTLPDENQDELTTSCQREWELNAGIVQLGNKIASSIATQFFLNHIRGEKNPAFFSHMF